MLLPKRAIDLTVLLALHLVLFWQSTPQPCQSNADVPTVLLAITQKFMLVIDTVIGRD